MNVKDILKPCRLVRIRTKNIVDLYLVGYDIKNNLVLVAKDGTYFSEENIKDNGITIFGSIIEQIYSESEFQGKILDYNTVGRKLLYDRNLQFGDKIFVSKDGNQYSLAVFLRNVEGEILAILEDSNCPDLYKYYKKDE